MIYLNSFDENNDVHPLPINIPPATRIFNASTPGRCTSCLQPIADQYFLMIGDLCWHSNCLRCCDCQCTLQAQTSCFYKDGLVFCREDYVLKFSKRCGRCSSILACTDVVMRARDVAFHLQCFTCIICSIPLRPGEIFAMCENKNLYCQEHYASLLNANCTNSLDDLNSDMKYIKTKQRYRKRRKSIDEKDQRNVKACCEDEGMSQSNRSKRMRTSFKHHQLRTMKSYFNLNHNPDAKDLKQLSQRTGLSKRVLQVWFQNARAKFRRNNTRNRDLASVSPRGNQINDIQATSEQRLSSTNGSIGDSITISPDGSQKNDSFGPLNGNLDNSRCCEMKSEQSCINESPDKTLASYFESEPNLL